MTRIIEVTNVCHICGTEYSGSVLASWNTRLPKPEIKPLACPKCGAPYKPGVKLQVGMAKEVLLRLLESKDAATDTLFRFSRTVNDLNEWINYVKGYVTPQNLAQWREDQESTVRRAWGGIQTHQQNKPNSSQTPEEEIQKRQEKVNQIEQIVTSGEMDKLLDEIKLTVQKKITDELNAFKVQASN